MHKPPWSTEIHEYPLKAIVDSAEYDQMLAAARAIAHPVNPRDVVVAIVGGTLLALALTRPRLRWVEQLTEDSPIGRLWAERALTIFAFAMGGYAWTSLYVVLHKQLGSDIDAVLRGAACFMIVYAWLVHFEPFLQEWRQSGWLAASVLYTGIAVFAASFGIVVAEILLASRFSLADLRMLSVTGTVAGLGWLFYKLLPPLEALMEGAGPKSRVSPTLDASQVSEENGP